MRLATLLVSMAGLLPVVVQAKAVTQVSLNTISDKCHMDRSALVLRGKDEIDFQPRADARQDAIECTFNEIRKGMYPPNVKIGIVGKALPSQKAR